MPAAPPPAEPRARASPLRDACVLALIACAYFLSRKLYQYVSFGVHGELADFESILWNTLHGRFFVKGPGEASFFAEHASPVLLALLPIYAVFRSPIALLVVQALAAAAAVVPLHLMALRLLRHRPAAIAVSVSYILSYLVHRGVMYDVHMEIFYPAFFLWALLAVETRRWRTFFLALLLALAVKEDAAIAALGLGLYLTLSGFRRQGSATVLLAVAYLALVFGLVVPHFRTGPEAGGYAFLHYWSGYGHSPGEIARNMLNPLRHAVVLFTAEKLTRTLTLLSSFLFLPLFSWRAALFLVLPNWFILYASNYPVLYGPGIYYGLLITPFLFYATLKSLRAMRERWGGRVPRLVPIAAGLLLLVNLANSALFRAAQPAAWRVDPRYRTATRLIASIPRSAPVAAQVGLVSHIPIRRDRHLLPEGIARAEYLLFDAQGDPWPLTGATNRALLDSLRAAGTWIEVETRDGFSLLQRRP